MSDKTKTYRGHWYLTGIHEFVGHALQQKFSEKMPLSLRCGPKNFNHITGGTNSEGAAMFTEIYSMDWFNQKSTKEFLNLGRYDMKVMNVFVKPYIRQMSSLQILRNSCVLFWLNKSML